MPRGTKFRSINDSSQDVQYKTRCDFIDINAPVIQKHLTRVQVAVLKELCLSFLFGRLCEISIPESDAQVTRHCFSTEIVVPRMLEFIGRLLIEGELKNSEIFRVNSTRKRVEGLLDIARQMTTAALSRQQGMWLIQEKYTMVDIAEAYKVLFKQYDCPVIPQPMVQMAIQIEAIEDAEEKRVCAKALVFSIPPANRRILESCVYVCTRVVERLRVIESQKKMNLSGLAIVMMPNLMRPVCLGDDYMSVKRLSDFLCYVFENFEDLLKICS